MINTVEDALIEFRHKSAALPSAEEGKEAKAGAPIAPWAMALKIRGNGITAERAGEMLDEWRKASLAMTLPDDPRFPMLCSDGSVIHNVAEARAKAKDYPECFTTEELADFPTRPSEAERAEDWATIGATQWLEREKHVFERGGIPYKFTAEDVEEMAKHFRHHAKRGVL